MTYIPPPPPDFDSWVVATGEENGGRGVYGQASDVVHVSINRGDLGGKKKEIYEKKAHYEKKQKQLWQHTRGLITTKQTTTKTKEIFMKNICVKVLITNPIIWISKQKTKTKKQTKNQRSGDWEYWSKDTEIWVKILN